MKKVKKINIVIIIATVFSMTLSSCRDHDSSEVERFKNEYRDPNIIGKWQMVNNEDSEYYVDIFKKEGEWETETKDLNGRKHKQFSHYYYTNGNKLYYLSPGSTLKGGRDSGSCVYSIKNDTLVLTYGTTPDQVSKYIKVTE